MVIQTWQLFLIFLLFVAIIWITLHFALQSKNKKINQLASDLHFELVDIENVPPEYGNLSTHLRYFWSYEFLTVKKINGIQIYFTQYLEKRSSQIPYLYALVSLFQVPLTFSTNDERVSLQKQIDTVFPGAVLTENGIFYYHPIPWNLKKTTLEVLVHNMVQAVEFIQK